MLSFQHALYPDSPRKPPPNCAAFPYCSLDFKSQPTLRKTWRTPSLRHGNGQSPCFQSRLLCLRCSGRTTAQRQINRYHPDANRPRVIDKHRRAVYAGKTHLPVKRQSRQTALLVVHTTGHLYFVNLFTGGLRVLSTPKPTWPPPCPFSQLDTAHYPEKIGISTSYHTRPPL